jgi:hypothetical protein
MLGGRVKIRWDDEKNRVLKFQRGVSFREMVRQRMIAIVDHPSRPGQQKMLFEYKGYVWAVPFVAYGDEAFLKTMYPCRKYTKLYKGELNK